MNRRGFLHLMWLTPLVAALPVAATPRPARTRGLVCTPPDMYGNQMCEAGIDSSVLDIVAADRQDASNWCWAACIQAVMTYYGHPIEQARIVADVWGDVVNLPAYPDQILRSLNRRWVDDYGAAFRTYASSVGTNAVTAAQDLANDQPLIIGTRGHAVVLTSLTYVRYAYGGGSVTLAEVRDPWPDSPGHRALTPREWLDISFAARIRVLD